MISNRNIINIILEIKKQVLQPYNCLIDSLFLIERFIMLKKSNKPKKPMVFLIKKTDQPWCKTYIYRVSIKYTTLMNIIYIY